MDAEEKKRNIPVEILITKTTHAFWQQKSINCKCTNKLKKDGNTTNDRFCIL